MLIQAIIGASIFAASATERKAVPVATPAPAAATKADTPPAPAVAWHDLKTLTIEGRGWNDTKSFYDRLPAKAESKVRSAVWGLSRHSAGICARFVTDADTIHARWNLTSSSLQLPHMSASGVSGLDLYIRHQGQWRWLAATKPDKPKMEAQLIAGLPAGEHEFLLYLPLYNGVSSVEIGVPAGKTVRPAKPSERKPIVFYGTSITQGASASRPGMAHTALLGRWLEYPVINLGFSGNGIMEPEIAELLAELDPTLYVIDCLPNMRADQIKERAAPLVRTIRKAHPETPILLVEDRTFPDALVKADLRDWNATSRAALRSAFEQLQSEGVQHLAYLEGENLLGDDGEGTVDHSHPNDLGFYRQAKVFATALQPLLPQEPAAK